MTPVLIQCTLDKFKFVSEFICLVHVSVSNLIHQELPVIVTLCISKKNYIEQNTIENRHSERQRQRQHQRCFGIHCDAWK